MHPEGDAGEDVIGLGPGDPRGPRWTRRRRAVAGAVLLAVACAAVVTAVLGHPGHSGPGAGAASASNPAGGLPPPAGAASMTIPASALLGERGDWELDMLGSQAADLSAGPMLVRIQFGTGTVTQVPLPLLGSTGPAQVAAGPGQVMIRPLDAVPGYTVPDGKPARGLPASLGRGGVMFPGPQAGQFWVTAGSSARPVLRLVSVSGGAASPTIRVPAGLADFATTVADGQGYVLVQDKGAVYDARPSGWRKVADGTLTAVGPSAWLISRCQGTDHCRSTVVNPVTRVSRALPGSADLVTPDDAWPPGVVSPDGRFAAVLGRPQGQSAVLRLVDLRTGAGRQVLVGHGGLAVDGFAWSPDSRWLFAAPGDGTLDAIDGQSGQVRDLGISLPPVIGLIARND
jgi:hypothetical protein